MIIMKGPEIFIDICRRHSKDHLQFYVWSLEQVMGSLRFLAGLKYLMHVGAAC